MPVWTRCLNQIYYTNRHFLSEGGILDRNAWAGFPKVHISSEYILYQGIYKLREFFFCLFFGEAWSYFKVFSLPTMPQHCVFLCIGCCCCYYFHWCRDERSKLPLCTEADIFGKIKKKEKKNLLGWVLKVVLPLKDISINKYS